MMQYTGVLFADLRGFTARLGHTDPQQASLLLRRFYRCAEDVLFPDAVIDKLIGDEVMALYLPDLKPGMTRDEVPARMLDHARDLLRSVGYASGSAPFVEVGRPILLGRQHPSPRIGRSNVDAWVSIPRPASAVAVHRCAPDR
jgi:adenylate cyclase